MAPKNVYGMPPSCPEDYDPLHLSGVRERWDQKAERWDRDVADEHFHLNEDHAFGRFLEAADAVVARRAEFCRSQLLVDLGCGTGLVLAHFLDRFARGLGIDISPQMLALAESRQLPRTEFLVGNGFELDGHVPAAGAVLSRGILLSHYGPRWAPLLLEQVRPVLCPGGFTVLDFLNAAARHDYASNPANKSYYSAEQVASLAGQAGFARATVLGEPERRVLLLLAEC
ncbi:MAG: class I SAM-dependent methyltransferase [Thermoguttaceae bacterium]